MKRENVVLLALFLLAIMSLTLVPAKAFIYPDSSVDAKYELFGPRLDRIQVIMYDGLDAMWTALQGGDIDVTDWPLTKTWLTTFTTPPANAKVQVISYGGEAGYYTLDFNENNNLLLGNPPGTPAGYKNPVATPPNQNPASDVHFRRGCSYLFNRTWYAGIIAGWGIMMYTPVPTYMGSTVPGEGYVHQEIRPGGTLEALTYPLSDADADVEFGLGKFKIVAGQAGGKRFWDRNDNNVCDPGEDITIILNARQDEGRKKAAEHLTAQLAKHGFKMDTSYLTGGQNYQKTMLDKNYHVSTLGWIFIGPDPDFLYDLYHVTAYWHDPESSCPNTADLNDTQTNLFAEDIKFAASSAAAKTAAWNFQARFATIAAQIPLFCNDGFKANYRTYCGGPAPKPAEEAAYIGDKWLDLANQMGFGSNSWFSFFNAYPEGHETGDGTHMTIRYGWKETGYPQHINPLYSEWYWDAEVLGKVYDSLGFRDPYALSTWKPYLIKDWKVGTWVDPATGVEKSKVRVTLRPDVKFADGTPLTVGDVIYSLTEVAHDLVKKGWPPPWSWPTTEQVQSAYIVDPYNVEILFKVKSFLAESWALGGFYIIPKHIWKPIVDTGDPTRFAADPNVIGTGPWRYVSFTPLTSLLMVANTQGSKVKTDRAGSIEVTSPGVFATCPVDVNVYADDFKAKFLPGSTLHYTVKLHNGWWYNKAPTTLVVDKYVYVNDKLKININGIPLATCVPDIETFSTTPGIGKEKIKVAVQIKGGTPTPPAAWLNQWVNATLDPWITIKEDIGGSYIPEPVFGFPAPDFKVDLDDVIVGAIAFATTPGHARWSPVADITGDYLCDIDDIIYIALKFGWVG